MVFSTLTPRNTCDIKIKSKFRRLRKKIFSPPPPWFSSSRFNVGESTVLKARPDPKIIKIIIWITQIRLGGLAASHRVSEDERRRVERERERERERRRRRRRNVEGPPSCFSRTKLFHKHSIPFVDEEREIPLERSPWSAQKVKVKAGS